MRITAKNAPSPCAELDMPPQSPPALLPLLRVSRPPSHAPWRATTLDFLGTQRSCCFWTYSLETNG